VYNIYDTLNDILPQQIFERRAMLVWVGGACLPVCDPLVNGVGNAMFCTICDFFIIGHLFGVNMNEIEVIVADSEAEWAPEGHVRL
jgi:hypothetical protein